MQRLDVLERRRKVDKMYSRSNVDAAATGNDKHAGCSDDGRHACGGQLDLERTGGASGDAEERGRTSAQA